MITDQNQEMMAEIDEELEILQSNVSLEEKKLAKKSLEMRLDKLKKINGTAGAKEMLGHRLPMIKSVFDWNR